MLNRAVSHQSQSSYYNETPEAKFRQIDDLRRTLKGINSEGDAFLNFLLDGSYFDGKGVWVNERAEIQSIYGDILRENPHLDAESPYGAFFNREKVRIRGENVITLADINDAPMSYKIASKEYGRAVAAGQTSEVAIFSGGPATKIAAILATLRSEHLRKVDVKFFLDGAEQSNESGSASYEHVNHANALNAEHDNTALGILLLALKRALFGEKNPDVALETGYHKVDMWPTGLRLRDFPIYVWNEFHGRIQWLKHQLHIQNDHDKSRTASKLSTHVLSYIEAKVGTKLRLNSDIPRAIFVYFTKKHHKHSLLDYKILSRTIGLEPRKLSGAELEQFYGAETLRNITSADIFYENFCIRHGFDKICAEAIRRMGGAYTERVRIKTIYLTNKGGLTGDVVGVATENTITKEERFEPLSYLGLSLGPTATYDYDTASSLFERLNKRFRLFGPVPHQTIATGFTAQILFKITDPVKFKILPYTGLKQTHFVEIARNEEYVLVKLTSGGVIGLPVYSRSYAISALANMLRIMIPDTGLEFFDVVCAWPCTRGINGPNNGQIVRLADNAAARFGEGGTGMSKMGTNAQTILDCVGLFFSVPENLRLPHELYEHTIIDNRGKIARRLRLREWLLVE